MEALKVIISASEKSYPRKILNISFAITIIIIVVLGIFNWYSYSDFQNNTSHNYALKNLQEKIIHLDEKLTTSARLAAMTGDIIWERDYNQNKSKIDSAINEIKNLTKDSPILKTAVQIDSANAVLENFELEASKLVRMGKTEDAKKILFGAGYEKGKMNYKEGINQLAERLNIRIQESNQKNQDAIQLELLLLAISFVIVLFVWWISIFVMKKYNREQKKTERLLEEKEQTYRDIFENSADGMFLMSEVFEDCNQAVCKLFRCDREDIIGKSPFDFSPEIQPDGKNSELSAKEKISDAHNGNPQRFYWQHKTKDNLLFDADVALSAISIKGKQVIHAVVRDISETVRLEKIQHALFEISEAAYTATDMVSLYKRIHEIVSTLMLAKNFYIAMYDENAGMISFPYMVDEFDPPYEPQKLGNGLTEYILRNGKAELIDAKFDLELRESGEVEMVGTPTLIWLGVPLNIGEKTIGVIVVQDYQNAETYGEEEKQLLVFVAKQIAQVIERKRNSESIKIYAEQLKQLNQTKDRFFSIIAHDLKSPFQSLLGLSELLTSPDVDLSLDEKEEYIQTLFILLKNQYELLQNLLEWGAIQMGKTEYRPVKINIFEIVAEKIELLSKNAKNKSINIVNETGKDIFVLSDKHILGSVLQNFMANAIKFTNREGKIKIYTDIDGDFVRTTVEDNGIGITKEVLENIFSLDSVHTTQGTEGELGTGLGLMLCKEMIEKNGGNLKIESEFGKGTRVIFTTPVSS